MLAASARPAVTHFESALRYTQLHENSHHYWGNGVGAMATLRRPAMHLLGLTSFESIHPSIRAVMHDSIELLVMAMRQLQQGTSCDFGSALGGGTPCFETRGQSSQSFHVTGTLA